MPLFTLLWLTTACTENNLSRLLEPPRVTILAPGPGEVLRQSEEPARFEAQVEDDFDRPEDLELLWRVAEVEGLALADREGRVTFELATAGLPTGPVAFTLTAVDLDGEQGQDSVTFELGGPEGAPVVTITAPGDGEAFALGATIAFQGEATDSASPPEDLRFSWVSDLDGPLGAGISGGGASALITDGLSEGVHRVRLEVEDGDGERGEAEIEVAVGRPGGGVVEEALPGDLVFSEMMINPELVWDEVGEWVELYNTAGYDIDLGGYAFHDDDVDRYVLAGPLIAPAGGYIVLCADTDPALNGGVQCDGRFVRDYQGGGLALANHEDEVVLSRPDGVEIDWLHYDGDWFQPGVAIGVDPGFLDSGANDDPARWCDQVSVMASGELGTPRAANDPCGG